MVPNISLSACLLVSQALESLVEACAPLSQPTYSDWLPGKSVAGVDEGTSGFECVTWKT